MRRFLDAHVRNAGLQAVNFIDYLIAPRSDPVNLSVDLRGIDEIMCHIHSAGGHQHGASDGNATGHRQTVYGESHNSRSAGPPQARLAPPGGSAAQAESARADSGEMASVGAILFTLSEVIGDQRQQGIYGFPFALTESFNFNQTANTRR